MRVAGGVLGILAGLFGIGAALFTLLWGGVGAAVEAEGAEQVIGFGIYGLVLSIVVTAVGAATVAAKGRIAPSIQIITSIVTAFLGGTFVAICMSIGAIGGLVALLEPKPKAKD